MPAKKQRCPDLICIYIKDDLPNLHPVLCLQGNYLRKEITRKRDGKQDTHALENNWEVKKEERLN